MGKGSLIVFCGPMFGSKTTRLLATIDRYTYQKKDILVFKPSIDDRYSEDEISTHSGLKYPAIVVKNYLDIQRSVEEFENKNGRLPDVIAVDETFMLLNVAPVLKDYWMKGINVVVSSLDLDYQLRPFEELARLLPYATHIEKCPAVCVECNVDAFYTRKDIPGGDRVEVGGADIYSPVCREHHNYF